MNILLKFQATLKQNPKVFYIRLAIITLALFIGNICMFQLLISPSKPSVPVIPNHPLPMEADIKISVHSISLFQKGDMVRLENTRGIMICPAQVKELMPSDQNDLIISSQSVVVLKTHLECVEKVVKSYDSITMLPLRHQEDKNVIDLYLAMKLNRGQTHKGENYEIRY